MKPETLEALKQSIEHWKRNASGDYDGIGGSQCFLCRRFCGDASSPYPITGSCYRSEPDEDDEDCPVKTSTGETGCAGTPYRTAYDMCIQFGKTSEQFKKASQKEVEFLEALLPKD